MDNVEDKDNVEVNRKDGNIQYFWKSFLLDHLQNNLPASFDDVLAITSITEAQII